MFYKNKIIKTSIMPIYTPFNHFNYVNNLLYTIKHFQ